MKTVYEAKNKKGVEITLEEYRGVFRLRWVCPQCDNDIREIEGSKDFAEALAEGMSEGVLIALCEKCRSKK